MRTGVFDPLLSHIPVTVDRIAQYRSEPRCISSLNDRFSSIVDVNDLTEDSHNLGSGVVWKPSFAG
jgi:hypothetical protein